MRRTRTRPRRTPLSLLLILSLIASVLPMSAALASTNPLVTPTAYPGNLTCASLFDPGPAFELKVDPPKSGNYGPLSVEFYEGGKAVKFTSTVAVLGVFVKGGNLGGNFYDYREYTMPGATEPGVTADSNLRLPNPNQAISHVSFCWDKEPVVPKGLTATKTAVASYDRTITWDLAKSVAPTQLTGLAGQEAGSVNWNVVATKTDVETNFKVTGNITINNPNAIAVNFSVSDKLDDGTEQGVEAQVTCPASSVPANGSITCTYEAKPADKEAFSNTALVTSLTDGVPGSSATALITTWNENLTGDKDVTLADPRFKYSKLISADTTENFPEEFECPADPNLYTDGKYTFIEKNTATLTGPKTKLEEQAEVEITCTLASLTATKTAAGKYDREITWDLKKNVAPLTHTGEAGDTFESTWTVTATKNVKEYGHQVDGAITITNLGSIAQTFTVEDVLDDGAVGAVKCPSYTVPAGGQVVCTYVATTAGATLNTATVTAPGNPKIEATAAVSYTPNVIGDEKVDLTDPRFAGAPWNFKSEELDDTATRTFEETFACPTDAKLYTNGILKLSETNTAFLKGGATNLSADATVGVDCTLPKLVPAKTAEARYDRTITWELTKKVDPGSHSGQAGDEFGSTWSVLATKKVVEGNNKVTGTITITNPAKIPQTITGIQDTLSDGKVASVTCPTMLVPAGGEIECTYTASPSDRTAFRNHVAVKADGNPAQTARKDFTWTANVSGDEMVKLEDPRFKIETMISVTTPITQPEKFECSTDPGKYTEGTYNFTETNFATLTGGNTDLKADASVKVDCTLPALTAKKDAAGSYDRNINWQLEKSVDPASHSGWAGSSFDSTWTVKATKSVVEDNHKVTGKIEVTNPANIAQTFTVEDILTGDIESSAKVTCPSYTVDPGKTVTCTYEAAVKGAKLNTATVSAPGNKDVVATANVEYTAIVKGDEEVTLGDKRFEGPPWNYVAEKISDTTTRTFPETFLCPTDAGMYDANGLYSFTEKNIATLTGTNTNLEADASVTVDCKRQLWMGETATGAGKLYPGSSNWFMYTPYTTAKVDLVAGQWYDAGDIFMTRSGSTTNIRFVLHDGFRWADVKENLKIQPFDREPTAYVSPGAFAHKFTVSGNTVTVSIPNSGKARFFGIHGDVERHVDVAPTWTKDNWGRW
jgi:hypothetical protein